jgi:hypothetical protein
MKAAFYGTIYFLLGFLPPFGALYSEYAEFDQWPPAPRQVAVLFAGLVCGLSSVRAFMDQSISRAAEAKTIAQP